MERVALIGFTKLKTGEISCNICHKTDKVVISGSHLACLNCYYYSKVLKEEE
jgi:hypothetical protein